MIHPRKHRSGFATVIAMISLTLVGITMAGLMTRITMQAQRTRAEENRAQREQINIARSLSPSPRAVTLPSELQTDRQ